MSTTDERAASRTMPDFIPAEARAMQGQRAGFISRLVANLFDFAVVIGVLIATYAAWCGVLLLWKRKGFEFPTPSFAQAFIAAAVVLVLYFTVAWTGSGRTYGDRFMGLRVVDRDGSRLRVGWSFIRAIFCWLFPIGLLWAALSRENRSIQDLVLRTSVRHEWGNLASGPPSTGSGSGDPARARVDVEAPVADEPGQGHPEPLAGLDGQ